MYLHDYGQNKSLYTSEIIINTITEPPRENGNQSPPEHVG